MTKLRPITNTILFNIYTKLTTTTAWRWSCSDKKDRNKKQHRNLTYWKGVKAKYLNYVSIKFKLIWWYTAYRTFYLSGCPKLVWRQHYYRIKSKLYVCKTRTLWDLIMQVGIRTLPGPNRCVTLFFIFQDNWKWCENRQHYLTL